MPVMELSEALGSLVIYSEFSFLFPLRKSYLKLNSSRYKNCAHAQGFHRAASCPLPTTSLSPPLFPQVIPSMDSAEMVLFLPLSQTGRDTLVNSWNAVCFFLFVCFCLILCLDTVCNFKFIHVAVGLLLVPLETMSSTSAQALFRSGVIRQHVPHRG